MKRLDEIKAEGELGDMAKSADETIEKLAEKYRRMKDGSDAKAQLNERIEQLNEEI